MSDPYDLPGMVLAILLPGLAAWAMARLLLPRLQALLARLSAHRAEMLLLLFDRMFMESSLSRCQTIIWTSVALPALLFLALTFQLGWVCLAFALAAGLAGWFLPLPAVRLLWTRRVHRFEDQLVGALTMMANALRSGLSMLQAVEIVARDASPPISQEFSLVLKEQAMGKRIEDALNTMAERIPSQDLVLVTNSITMLRETGGNLPMIFESILFTILERQRVQGRIKALTAEGVTQGVILTAMPFVLGLALHYINPVYIEPLFTTVIGWCIIALILVLLAAGVWMMHQIIKIDI